MLDCENIENNIKKGLKEVKNILKINEGSSFDDLMNSYKKFYSELKITDEITNNITDEITADNYIDETKKSLENFLINKDKKILIGLLSGMIALLNDKSGGEVPVGTQDDKRDPTRFICPALIACGSIALLTSGPATFGLGVGLLVLAITIGDLMREHKDAHKKVLSTFVENSNSLIIGIVTGRGNTDTKMVKDFASSTSSFEKKQRGGEIDKVIDKVLCLAIQTFMEENNIEDKLNDFKNPPGGETTEDKFERINREFKEKLGETEEATKKAEEYLNKGGRRMRKVKGKSLKKRGGRKSIKKGVKKVVKKGGRKSVRKTLNKRGRKSVRR
jgi:hypothetical protein